MISIRVYDIVIVGAGPSGNHLAGLLAAKGFEVLVVEEHEGIGDEVICSGILGLEAFEHYRLGRDFVVGTIAAVNVVGPDGSSLRFSFPKPLAHVVDRRAFDQDLARRARSRGASYLVGTRVHALEDRGDRMVAVGQRRGHKVVVEGRVAVLATGAGSALVRRCFGQPPGWVWAAQVEVPVRGLAETEIYLGSYVAPGSFGWAVPVGVVPGSDGGVVTAKVGLLAYDRPRQRLVDLLTAGPLRERLQLSPAGGVEGVLEKMARSIRVAPLPLGSLPRTAAPRLLVVGEAAGQVKTTTGGGIYYGMMGADAAAEAIEQAFAFGDFGASPLSQYDRLWRQRLGREIAAGLRLRSLVRAIPDQVLASLIRLARYDGLNRLITGAAARFDWHADLIEGAMAHPVVRKWLAPGSS